LIEMGSAVATPGTAEAPTPGLAHAQGSGRWSLSGDGGGGDAEKLAFGVEHTQILEEWIDFLDGQLPKLTKFILPVT